VVCVNTDAPEVKHLVTVCMDSLTTGSLVGELMGRFLVGKGRVMVVTAQLSTIDHAQKVAVSAGRFPRCGQTCGLPPWSRPTTGKGRPTRRAGRC
jgi:hypothetical protein